MSRTILLFTPGLDSFISNWLLERSGSEYKRVYIDLQSRYSEPEKIMLNQFDCANDIDWEFMDLGNIEKSDAHIQNRNLMMIAYVAAKYNPNRIIINGVKDDRVEDNNQIFYDKIQDLLRYLGHNNITVESLLIDREKSEWVALYARDNKNDYINLLDRTYSCFYHELIGDYLDIYSEYKDEYKIIHEQEVYGCRCCSACFRRFSALTAANIYVPFDNMDLLTKYENSVDADEYPNRKKSIDEYVRFNTFL